MRKIILRTILFIIFITILIIVAQYYSSHKVEERIYERNPPSINKAISRSSTHHTISYHGNSGNRHPSSPSEPVAHTATGNVTIEEDKLLKYVLFSVSYDKSINEGETESLQLKMTWRDLRADLEKMIPKTESSEENLLNFIDKIQERYKYVSADLVAKNGCLKVEKKRPSETYVYLPSLRDSTSYQLWQWDLTAPENPPTTDCKLSLFIRFCEKESTCIPTEDPDKEILIQIQVSLFNHFIKNLKEVGEIAGSIGVILALLATILGWHFWKKKE